MTRSSGTISRGAIYNSIFWQFLAYQEGGIGLMTKLRDARQIDNAAFKAWTLIDQAAAPFGPLKALRDGNFLLADYEQRVVLQPILKTKRGRSSI